MLGNAHIYMQSSIDISYLKMNHLRDLCQNFFSGNPALDLRNKRCDNTEFSEFQPLRLESGLEKYGGMTARHFKFVL